MVGLYKEGHSATPGYLRVLFSGSDLAGIIQRVSLLGKLADQDHDLFRQVQTHLQKTQEREAALAAKRQEQSETMADLTAAQAEMYERMKASAVEYRRLKSQVAALQEAARKAAEAERAKAPSRRQESQTKAAARCSPGRSLPSERPIVMRIHGEPRGREGGPTKADIMAPKGSVVACVTDHLPHKPHRPRPGWDHPLAPGNNGTSYYSHTMNGSRRASVPGSPFVPDRSSAGWETRGTRLRGPIISTSRSIRGAAPRSIRMPPCATRIRCGLYPSRAARAHPHRA